MNVAIDYSRIVQHQSWLNTFVQLYWLTVLSCLRVCYVQEGFWHTLQPAACVECRAVKLAENGEGASSSDVDHEKVSFASKPANACLHFADLGFRKHVATNH